jgi:hypothetical protein
LLFLFLGSVHLTSGGFKYLGKSMQSQNTQALLIRRGIKATVGQLDRWESDQLALQQRRELANSRFPHGVKDRLALARHRAGSGKNGPPYCDFCDASGHSTDPCQVSQDIVVSSETESENPTTAIHRAIVHRLYLQACDLYRSSYPLFYLGAAGEESIGDPTKEVPAASLTCPDYFALSIDYAVEDFKASSGVTPSDIRQQQSNGLSTVQLHYSKSFPVNFSEFCDLIANRLEDISS